MRGTSENGFEQAEREHREAFAKLSAKEKLDWLQQAKDFLRKYLGAAHPTSAKT